MKQQKRHCALKDAGALLKRSKRHNICQLPDRRIFVTAKTPSDRRGEDNALSARRKLFGLARVS